MGGCTPVVMDIPESSISRNRVSAFLVPLPKKNKILLLTYLNASLVIHTYIHIHYSEYGCGTYVSCSSLRRQVICSHTHGRYDVPLQIKKPYSGHNSSVRTKYKIVFVLSSNGWWIYCSPSSVSKVLSCMVYVLSGDILREVWHFVLLQTLAWSTMRFLW